MLLWVRYMDNHEEVELTKGGGWQTGINTREEGEATADGRRGRRGGARGGGSKKRKDEEVEGKQRPHIRAKCSGSQKEKPGTTPADNRVKPWLGEWGLRQESNIDAEGLNS